MKPESLIKEAKKNFFFAAIQWAAMENNLFKHTDLPEGFNWTVGGESRHLGWENRSEKGFRALVLNQLRAALAVSAIGVDSVLSDHFGNKPYEDTDDERRAARCAIYMIRCAFAHNPLEPKWNVTSTYYNDIFNVPSANFTLDTRELNGKPLDHTNFDWFGMLDLMDYCAMLVG